MGSLARDGSGRGAQWHCFLLCQELLAQHEAVDGDGVVDGRAGVRDGRGEGRGVRLADGPGLLRQEVRLHVRWGQERDVRAEGSPSPWWSSPPRGWAAPTSTPSWRSLDSCAKLPIFKVKKMLLYKKFLLFISLIPNT